MAESVDTLINAAKRGALDRLGWLMVGSFCELVCECVRVIVCFV